MQPTDPKPTPEPQKPDEPLPPLPPPAGTDDDDTADHDET